MNFVMCLEQKERVLSILSICIPECMLFGNLEKSKLNTAKMYGKRLSGYPESLFDILGVYLIYQTTVIQKRNEKRNQNAEVCACQ